MVCCVHHIPGRVRFRIEALRDDTGLAERIREQVSSLAVVTAVEVNRHARSVVVHYQPQEGRVGEIMDHICINYPVAALTPMAQRAAREAVMADDARATPSSIRLPSLPNMPEGFSRALGRAASQAVVKTLVSRLVGV
ncbi:MAG: HMA2 domain-containing protein [Paenirhodobacter sp.]|uniref:HMA2 domain-containing protein n=1 Tax=Paenirhodobacter sp. TaxID=1965326 RepID=UPI003D0EA000